MDEDKSKNKVELTELDDKIKVEVDTTFTKFTPNEAIEEVKEMIEDFLVDEEYIGELDRTDSEKIFDLAVEIAVHLNQATLIMRMNFDNSSV